MPDDAEHPLQKLPAPCEAFAPREVFRGVGPFIPERIAASTSLSMTAKICYGHLLRRAGKRDQCWPSVRDIAHSVGVGKRQAMRALKELINATLIRSIARKEGTRRQTSNAYVFIWGPILQGEGDKTDTLASTKCDIGTLSHSTPPRVSEMTPLEVTKINHHQGRNKQRPSVQAESTVQGYSKPELSARFSHEVDDDDSAPVEYASGKDELKAIYLAKAGERFRVADLDAIESLLTGRGITWDEFVVEVRKHAWDRIENPVGFLRSLAKCFRAKIQLSSPPLTAAEVDLRDYKCSICGSAKRGEGMRLVDGKPVACSCASPEYIAHHRATGFFAQEDASA